MALCIDHPEADRLAHELAALTGESLTDVVLTALRERFVRVAAPAPRLRDELRAIRRRCAALPVRDARPPAEILGYDDAGVPR